MAETRANAYADGIVTEAEQNAINEAQARLDALQIGSVNLISKKMMLKWNEKNKDIAVWGQDADGIYLAVNQKLLYNSIAEGTERKDIFNNAIQFKQNTQNVLSFEYKSGKKIIFPIISFRIYYTDGSFANVNLSGSNTTKTRTDYITDSGKTVDRISLNDSTSNENALIYNISLIEGNKPLQGFPVAEEDQTAAPVWAPSFSEQQAEIKTITKTLTEIKAENGEISLRVNEVSERVEEAKQEAIDEAKEYTTIQTYRKTEIDLRAEKWDQDTYYPVTIKLPINDTRIEVATELGDAKPKWSTHEYGFSMNCVWRSNRSGWGANVVNRIIEVFEYRFTKEIPDTTPVQYILPAAEDTPVIVNV